MEAGQRSPGFQLKWAAMTKEEVVLEMEHRMQPGRPQGHRLWVARGCSARRALRIDRQQGRAAARVTRILPKDLKDQGLLEQEQERGFAEKRLNWGKTRAEFAEKEKTKVELAA
jgi:hypothetical protein